MMHSVSSYFNPFSREHHAIGDFNGLSSAHKSFTGVFTALAAIITFPLLGVGGVAAFRLLTEEFKIEELNQKISENTEMPVKPEISEMPDTSVESEASIEKDSEANKHVSIAQIIARYFHAKDK